MGKWGDNSGAVVVGNAVNDQRIERHNRAVNENVIKGYKKLFYEMEAKGIFYPYNPTDIFCLLYIFLPRINRTLKECIDAHNNHRVSTERNNTPSQLFFLNLNLTALSSGLSPEDTRYGMNETPWMIKPLKN